MLNMNLFKPKNNNNKDVLVPYLSCLSLNMLTFSSDDVKYFIETNRTKNRNCK